MSQPESYLDAAYILSIVGGVFIMLGGILIGLISTVLTFTASSLGAVVGLFGIILGVTIVLVALGLRFKPSQHSKWGAIIIILSSLSWIGSIGGFFIGFLLSLIGGIIAIVWHPTTTPAYNATVPEASPPAQFCPNCGHHLPANVVCCLNCGKQIQQKFVFSPPN
jgi:hypothetical protein